MNLSKVIVTLLAVAALASLGISQTTTKSTATASGPTTKPVVFLQWLNGYKGCENVATNGDRAEENLLNDRDERGLGIFGDLNGNWAFIRFNDLKLPAGWKLAKAELVLTITEHSSVQKTGLAVHRLTQKLDFAQISFAYRNLAKKEKWGTTQPADKGDVFPKAGVDFAEKPEATFLSTADKSEINIDITAAARDWLSDPAKNTGLVLRPPTDESVGWIASSQDDQLRRPKLILHLTPEK